MPESVINRRPRTYRIMLWALPYATVLIVGLFAFVTVHLVQDRNKIEAQVSHNRATVAFICSTTAALDALVVQAAAQIETSRLNGTYARLVKSGLLTRANVRQALRTQAYYRKVHAQLVGPQSKSCAPPAPTPRQP